jgi:alpha-L-fucosidase
MRVGLYYSPLDWRYPGFFFPSIYCDDAKRLREQYHRQLGELAENYGKLDILWFDGGGNDWLGFGGIRYSGGWKSRPQNESYKGSFDWQDDLAVRHLRERQPDLITNDRVDAPADFRVRESDSSLGGFENRYPWELNVTIVEGAFGYQAGAKVKSLGYLIRLLVGAAGRDGNFLLNVGPRPDGQIDPEQAQRLREIGQWLKANGESIYGTRGGPWLPGSYGVSTHRSNIVYLHLLRPPANTGLRLAALPERLVRVSLLSGPELAFRQADQQITINVPAGTIDSIDTVLKLELAKAWTTAAVIPVQDPPVE